MIDIFLSELIKYVIPFLSFIFLLGLFSYPITIKFFHKNIDSGFTSSYLIGFLSTSWIAFSLATLFTTLKKFLNLDLTLNLNFFYFLGILIWVLINCLVFKNQNFNLEIYNFKKIFLSITVTTVLTILFYIIFSFYSTYNPKGSETHLNIGILNSINFSNQVPINDFWLSGYSFNYYYFSHFAIAMLSNLLQFKVVDDFNFISIIYLVFFSSSIVIFVTSIIKKNLPEISYLQLIISGLITFAITFLINPIKSIYGLVELTLKYTTPTNIVENYAYYTIRIIPGTIAENFNYSFLVNPLHALSNNLFVGVLILNILFYLIEKEKALIKSKGEILVLLLLIGFSGLINTWDLIAYLGLFFVTVVYFSHELILKNPKDYIKKAILVIYPIFLIMLPWFMYFQSPSGLPNIVRNVSNLFDLFSLWGLYLISFLLIFLTSKTTLDKTKFSQIIITFGFVIILFLEMFYFMDIMRDGEYYRANTYYKFSNIVILLFSIGLSSNFAMYIIKEKNVLIKIFVSLLIYFTFWFNLVISVVRISEFKYNGLNSHTNVVKNFSPELLNLINYLNENAKPNSIIWEGSDNKKFYDYTNFVSVMTGIPTVIGWSNHEVTWRNMAFFYDIIKKREDDTKEFFTGENIETKKELLQKYNVNYIILGKSEREIFQDSLKTDLITELGEVVFEENDTKLIKINY